MPTNKILFLNEMSPHIPRLSAENEASNRSAPGLRLGHTRKSSGASRASGHRRSWRHLALGPTGLRRDELVGEPWHPVGREDMLGQKVDGLAHMLLARGLAGVAEPDRKRPRLDQRKHD